ncbi:hypothetical protein AD998_11845 [bacterium 336/3]|nr:hypothetical protein AD998_11845 [bacterium 336/3]
MKKIFVGIAFLYFLPVLFTILQSCNSCPEQKQTYFETTNMYFLINFGNKVYDEREIPVSSINQISFWLRMDVRYYGSINLFSGGFSAMACIPPKPASQKTVTSIAIYSNKDFEGYPAGTNLVWLLYMKDNNQNEGYLASYLSRMPKEAEGYNITFKENARPVSGVHQFKIIYENSAGKRFEANREIDFE